jgi:hypothetical protein
MNKEVLSFSLVLIFPGCLEECGGEATPEPTPNVVFVRPLNGAIVPESFEVEIRLENFVHDRAVDGTVELYLDRACPLRGEPIRDALPRVQFFDGVPTLALTVSAGPYTMCVGLADQAGLAVGGVDLVSISVVTSTAGPRVRIVSPSPGATMRNGERMRFEVEGYVIRPRAAITGRDERFLFVVTDEACVAEGVDVDDVPTAARLEAGQTEYVVYLAPGRHTLCVGVADVDGRVEAANASIAIDTRY